MKASNYFTRTILTYLEQRATTDTLFAESFANPDKDIDQCVCYILNAVQKSGCNGFADDEIYSMAVDFYNNDNVEIGKAINCKMVVNHVVELTVEEKEQARQDAIQTISSLHLTRARSLNCVSGWMITRSFVTLLQGLF